MNWYDSLGTLNTLFIFVSLIGVFSQLNKIWQRKQQHDTKHKAAELLSLNQFSVSFLAYFSFFIYGYSIEPFNHYIVWPRLIASLLVVLIITEIWRDRRSNKTATCLGLCLLILFLGILGFFFGEVINDQSKQVSSAIIVIVTVLIAQGYYHQIRLILRSGQTGAVDLRMSQFILMMDISTIAFALSMGPANGWPLLMLAIVSGSTKVVIMFLFRWVATSDTAKSRRSINA